MTLQQRFFKPVDNSPLILFRMVFGLLICLEAWGAIATGWVRRAFVEPDYVFSFIRFDFLSPLPGYGMYGYYIVMGLAGIMVMLGFYYRVGITIYAFMWAGVYLMQKTHYNNHYYLLMLFCFIMMLIPAHQYASLDVKRDKSIQSLTCPQWCIWVFVIHMTIVYIYASVAKMYPEWIEAKPISIWFKSKSHYFLIGPLLAQEWFQHVVAWGGIILDGLMAPGLIWKKTRKYAFIASVVFHLFNSAVFQVGIFPYMGIAMGVFFFDPETIRRIFFKKKPTLTGEILRQTSYKVNSLLTAVFTVYFCFQILLPLRHRLFPGNVNWTEEGHRLSWHMMLRVKYGMVDFRVIDKDSKEEEHINPTDYITPKQARSIATRPDMCWQFVQILKEDFKKKGKPNIEIYAEGLASLNGSKLSPLYDSKVDLAKVEWTPFSSATWLLPQPEEE